MKDFTGKKKKEKEKVRFKLFILLSFFKKLQSLLKVLWRVLKNRENNKLLTIYHTFFILSVINLYYRADIP